MADPIKVYGTINQATSGFEFSLDGMASYSQMKKLLAVTESMAKKMGADATGPSKEEKEEVDLLKDKNKQTKQSIDLEEEQQKRSNELDKKFRDLSRTSSFLQGNLSAAGTGYTTGLTLLTTGVGTLLGALSGYADQLQLGLQRGISGGVMDFAIAAKTGGVSLGSFSKALEESGGAFASLGDGATNGAKNFGSLIGSVRTATASVGNLGLSNDQLALLTAQQVKVAVSQGFKGTAAQNVVINNTRALAKELDILANQTGKSVLEMTQAAVKLAQDPLVSSFVRDIKTGGADAAKALNSYAANFTALFGKEGDKLARDTIGPALSGLPMIINDTGKNLALASQSTYNEIDRLAQKARSGEAMTDEDRQRLSETIKKEVAQRGQELRYMSELGGPMGESAKQFLSLAQEVENYNSAAGEQRRKEDKAAQEFNTAMNQFKANLQALAIPFLNLINGIDWTVFINTLSAFASGLGTVLHLLDPIGKFLGMGPGGLIGAILGLVAVIAIGKTGYGLLNKSVTSMAATFTESAAKIKLAADRLLGIGASGKLGKKAQSASLATAITLDSVSSPSTSKIGKGIAKAGLAGGLGGMMGGGLGQMGGEYATEKLGQEKNSGGAIGGTTGALAGGIAGAAIAGGLTVGTAGLGAFVAPAIVTGMSALGGFLGNVVGNTIGDWMSDDSSSLAETDMAAVDQSNQYQQASLKQGQQLNAKIDALNENMGYGNSISARGVAVAETGNRQLANLQYGNA
jgi:hypothetical protein